MVIFHSYVSLPEGNYVIFADSIQSGQSHDAWNATAANITHFAHMKSWDVPAM
jgi:hypothetical protein